MAKLLNLSIDVASDLFVLGGSWANVRRMSAMNADAIAEERRKYVAYAKGLK